MKTTSSLLELKNSFFTETPEINSSISQNNSTFQTTIVGYGRYGRNYIGPKYAKNGYSWEPIAIVDPRISTSLFKHSVLGENKPYTYLFQSFYDWYYSYFQLLDEKQKARQVIEIALKPELVYEQLMLYIEAGVKHFILPKPVVTNQQELLKLTETIQENQIKAAVSSQWYYSDVPKLIKRELNWMTKQSQKVYRLDSVKKTLKSISSIYKIEVNFSKENGLAYATNPPLLELPHALQLLSSIGLIDFDKHLPQVSGTDTVVNVVYRPENVTDGIYIQADIDMQPDPVAKNEHPLWDIQERSLKIYLKETSLKPDLELDFWIKFDSSGDFAIRPGQLAVTAHNGRGGQEKLVLNFVDDQLLQMNTKIYEAFQQSFLEFQNDNQILSLERYGGIGKQIMMIQKNWKSVKDDNSVIAFS